MRTKTRMAAPDIIKIAATIFVILIHHKRNSTYHFIMWYNLFFNVILAFSLLLATGLFLRALKSGSGKEKCIQALVLPVFTALGIIYLRWYAVCIFLVMSGYLMSGTLDRLKHPFAEWYTASNLTSRISRFYLPLIPVFALALLYKVFVLGKSYSLAEIAVRFFLGGFKPGSYYVVILAELVILFPFIHYVVRRYRFAGVMICTAFTFIYDILTTVLGMNPILYKFLIFRLTTHIAFGVYARYADYNREKIRNFILFIIGLIYAICCMYTDIYNPPIFFEWQEASFPTAFFLYPVIMWFMNEFSGIKYTESKISGYTLTFANATYHIFLIQLLYFTTIGFSLNEYINNAFVTLGMNVIITVPLGIAYFKILSPVENKIIHKIKKLQKSQNC